MRGALYGGEVQEAEEDSGAVERKNGRVEIETGRWCELKREERICKNC